MENVEKYACILAAKIYKGRVILNLTSREKALVELLERGGYIVPNNPTNGLVGDFKPQR